MHEDCLGILGAGRQAVETAGYCRQAGWQVGFFVEEHPPRYSRAHEHGAAPILSFSNELDGLVHCAVIAAVGDPVVRRRLVALWPGDRFVTLVSDHAWTALDVDLGEGCVVAPMAAVNRYCKLGNHVLVNVGAVLGHDVVVGDFTTISPGCSIGGLVTIGQDAFLGIGCTVRDRVRIGDGALVAAGAVVIKDVADGQEVLGVPAAPRKTGRE